MIEERQCKICGNTYPYDVIHFVKRVKKLKNVCCNCESIAREYRSSYKMDKNKELALKRDNYKCVKCGSEFNLQVHHIKKLKDGGNSSVENLITLCIDCHSKVHLKDGSYKLILTSKYVRTYTCKTLK